MTQKDKQLLIKDLSARLPYGVMCACGFHNDNQHIQNKKLLKIMSYTTNPYCVELDNGEYRPSAYMLDDIKPYLRPLYSMTEEEVKEFYDIECIDAKIGYIKPTWNWHFTINGIDWLNEKMFDYRGLIPIGRAIEAPKDMYI